MSVDTQAAEEDERQRIIAFGRAYVARKVDSAFSTAHLSNFLTAIEHGEHLSSAPRCPACERTTCACVCCGAPCTVGCACPNEPQEVNP